MKITFLYQPDSPATENMARDQALMTSPDPIIRFYTWSPGAISLGKSQKTQIIDRAACDKHGIEIVQRFTGGAAVLHKDELTYALFYPAGLQPRLTARILRKYVNDALVTVLNELGVPAQACKNAQWRMPESAICFHGQAENEVVVNGRKIGGHAQCVKRTGIFQHGSLLRQRNDELFRELLPHANPTNSTVGLDEYCPDIDNKNLAKMLHTAIENSIVSG